MKYRRWLPRLLGPIAFVYILTWIEFGAVVELMGKVDLWFYAMGFLLTWVIVTLRAWRWREINRQNGIVLRFKEEFYLYNLAFAIGIFTPGRAGEFAKVYYMSRKGIPSYLAFGSTFLDRLADLLWIVVFGYGGIVYYFSIRGEAGVLPLPWLLYFIPLSAAALMAGLFFMGRRWNRIWRRSSSSSEWLQKFQRGAAWLEQAFRPLLARKGNGLGKIIMLTGFSWMLQYYQAFLFSSALNLRLGFLDVATMVSVLGIISVLPISLAGLGSRELVLIALFGFLGLKPPEAMAFSMLIFSAIAAYFLGAAAMCAVKYFRENPSTFHGMKTT